MEKPRIVVFQGLTTSEANDPASATPAMILTGSAAYNTADNTKAAALQR